MSETARGRLTGIADESGAGIREQIANHRELGWNSLELRNVDGLGACEMPDEAFEKVRAAITEAGFKVVAFDSAIANWARPITGPFEKDLGDLRRAVPRMRSLGVRFIRIMSYTNAGLGEAEWMREALRRLKELTRMAEGEGVVLVHENCDGWASSTPENLARLLSEIPSRALQVAFDPGNPIAHGADVEITWKFFRAAQGRIAHFHIKDCKIEGGQVVHTMPGDGACDVENIIRELLKTGYSGMFSIEPHIATQIHLGGAAKEGVDQRSIYLEYGRRAGELLERALRSA